MGIAYAALNEDGASPDLWLADKVLRAFTDMAPDGIRGDMSWRMAMARRTAV